MRIRFVTNTMNHLTGNTMRNVGEVMDLRDDYASILVSRGYAVDMDAKPEPAPVQIESAPVEESTDFDTLHTNAIRAMAKDAGVWKRGMKREEMIEALTDNA